MMNHFRVSSSQSQMKLLSLVRQKMGIKCNAPSVGILLTKHTVQLGYPCSLFKKSYLNLSLPLTCLVSTKLQCHNMSIAKTGVGTRTGINNYLKSFHTNSYCLRKEDPDKHRSNDTQGSQSILNEKKWFVKIKKENIWTVPNILTFLRICATPVLGYLVLDGSYGFATSIFVFAGVTDVLDGYIARNFPNQTSSFGSYLDPLADKFLVSVLTITLTAVDLIPIPLALLIIGRDVGLIAAAFYVRYISVPPPLTLQKFFDPTYATVSLQPSTLSKANTAIQLSLVALTLAAPVFGYIDHPLLQGLWYLTATTTIASGLGYMLFDKHFYAILKKSRMKGKS